MIDFSAASDRLLGPLLDAAATTLRALQPTRCRNRRDDCWRSTAAECLAVPPARSCAARAESEESFREQVFAAYRAWPEVQAVLDGWQRADVLAVARAAAAAGGDELATLAGALIAAEPEGAELALGIVVALDAVQQLVDDDHDVNTEVAGRIAELEEKVRRADASRIAVEQARDELAEQLRAAPRAGASVRRAGSAKFSRAARRITELEDEIERERTGAEEAKNVSARVRASAPAPSAARAEAASSRAYSSAPRRSKLSSNSCGTR